MSRPVPFRNWTPQEHGTWRIMFRRQAEKRDEQVVDLFSRGIRELGLGDEGVPDLDEVNRRLAARTGFAGIPVEGLEEDRSFYQMLAERRFPIGNFIRDRQDVSYTPAPDVFHDLYGHLPFFIDEDYSRFCAELGERATRVADSAEALKQYARLFWFTIEFALMKTPQGMRIFGAGIASSHGECEYALGNRPNRIPFDIETIRKKDFKIDEFQRDVFVIEEPAQLYGCLPEFDRRVRSGG